MAEAGQVRTGKRLRFHQTRIFVLQQRCRLRKEPQWLRKRRPRGVSMGDSSRIRANREHIRKSFCEIRVRARRANALRERRCFQRRRTAAKEMETATILQLPLMGDM